MQSEDRLTEQMRRAIVPHLPERAFLRRDRGEGLFISNAPVFTAEEIRIPGFHVEGNGNLTRISPDKSWIALVEKREPEGFFSLSLLRFRGTEPGGEAMALFCTGCKLIDAGAGVSNGEIAVFDRNVRQLAAKALRGGVSGGGLYGLSLLDAWLKT